MKPQDLIPRPARRMRQPRKDVLREELARAATEIERLRIENEQLRRPWWRRLVGNLASATPPESGPCGHGGLSRRWRQLPENGETRMKHRPLTRWTCDTCGLDVVADEEAENGGYVNWGRGVAPVIVHKFGCQRDALPSSLPLSDFIGADGIALLTGMLSLGRLQVRHRRATRPEELEMLECLDGFVDFFRRVQLPYYEEARSRLATREVYEDWSDASEVAPYLQTSLQRILATGGESAESGDR